MDRKKSKKCDSCEVHFSYNKSEGFAVVFENCKHALCPRCYKDLTKTVESVECSVRSCREKSSYAGLLKVNCASWKVCCMICNNSLEGWCKELDCHHPVCNACSPKPLSCMLCFQTSEQMCLRHVFIKDQSIIRKQFATDIDDDFIFCHSCKRQKAEVKLCLCDHVVCRSCLMSGEKHEFSVNCPVSSLCQMRYPLDVLKSSRTKERDTSPPCGMPSVGLTCYAGCILQVLSNTLSFVTLLEQNASKKESFSDLLLGILKNKSEEEDKKQDIIHLLVFLESIDGTFDRFSQNDCASFLHVLLDALSRDDQTQGDFDVFFVDTIDEIVCSVCMSKEHVNFQRVLGIQLTTNMSEILDKDSLSEEIFENGPLKCFKCQNNVKLAKKTKMFSCPTVLVFQIQRIVETEKAFIKRTDPVEFSFNLKVVGSEDEKRTEIVYNLYAAVYHSGDLEAGHYYSAVRRGSDWYICDNEHIWKCSDAKEVLKFEDAYMLFYEQA